MKTLLRTLLIALLTLAMTGAALAESDYAYFQESEAYLGAWVNGDYLLAIDHSEKDENLFMCMVLHESEDDNLAEIWVYDGCAYDDISQGLSCEMIGIKTVYTYDEEGNEQEEVEFDDGAAAFNLNEDGDMVWTDFKQTPGEDKITFERLEFEEELEDDDLYAAIQPVIDSPEWVANLPEAQDENTTQLFVVAAMGMDQTTASISMHERAEDGTWKQILSTPGYVGKNGLCLDEDHAEGCAQTPVGVYHFNKAFGIAADPGCQLEYTQVDDGTYWSGDQREGMRYNEMVQIEDYPDLAMEDSEHIVDYEYQYRYCLNISFNEEGTPGRGSAIFLHCLGPVKPYTGGCVAIPEYIMKQVMQNVREDCVVVIDTLENMNGSF